MTASLGTRDIAADDYGRLHVAFLDMSSSKF